MFLTFFKLLDDCVLNEYKLCGTKDEPVVFNIPYFCGSESMCGYVFMRKNINLIQLLTLYQDSTSTDSKYDLSYLFD